MYRDIGEYISRQSESAEYGDSFAEACGFLCGELSRP